MPEVHPDADAILARLKKEGVNALYHFTCVENLPSIFELKGLYSKEALERLGKWPPPCTGGNLLSKRLDQRYDNWNKLSLSLTPYTPMAYNVKKEQHLCYLVISPEVSTWSGVVFTDTNAAKADHNRGEGLQGLDYVNFKIVLSIIHADIQSWKRYVQAEVLVPEKIPLKYIFKIAFVSKASMKYAEQKCGLSLPQFTVEERLFTDSVRASKETISFPYVLDLTVTDTNIDKNVLYFSHPYKNEYSKSQRDSIMMVASIKALAGTKARIILKSLIKASNQEEILIGSTEFETQNYYRHKEEIFLKDLSAGNYLLEYHLNELCWASTTFELLR